MVFLVYGVWLEFYSHHLAPSLNSFLFLQRSEPLILTLDFAPLVFGMLVGLVGRERTLSEIVSRGKKEWEATFDAFTDPIIVTNSDGQILRCNQAVLARLDTAYPEVIGKFISDLFPGGELSHDPSSSTGHEEFTCHGRSYRPSVYHIHVPELPDNILFILDDVTERRRLQETQVQEQNLLRAMIDNLPDRIYVKDREGRKTISNLSDLHSSGGKTMDDVLGN